MSKVLEAALAGRATQPKKYILPSTNSCIVLPSGRRVEAPDGTIIATSPELEAILEAMVECGNATVYTYATTLSSTQKIPDAATPILP